MNRVWSVGKHSHPMKQGSGIYLCAPRRKV
jgi:hypothetical protein